MNPRSFINSDSDISEASHPVKTVAKYALSAHFKHLTVIFENALEIEINIFRSEEKNLTIEWLHREIVQKINNELESEPGTYKRVTQIILEASPPNILLDYYLSLPKKSVFPIHDGQVLFARRPQPKQSNTMDDDEKTPSLDDFEVLSKLGWGKSSTVYLARKKSNGVFYAIKQMRKGVLKNPKLEKKLRYTERNNSIALRKPFLVNLHYTFQSDSYFYFVMDYLPGGNLRKILNQNGTFTEEDAQFYVAEILIALDIIHESGFIHRDLKTEKILIDDEGHIKINDFSKSKKVKTQHELNYSPVGSPRICSPEIISGKGYNVMTDYYSLGVLVYELTVGRSPHKSYGGDFKQIAQKILTEDPVLPDHISKDLEDFIMSLLCKDVNLRLGAEGGVEEIKSHPWLKGVNFEKIAARLVPPPIDPLDLIFEQNLMEINRDSELLENSEELDGFEGPLLFFDYNEEEKELEEKKNLQLESDSAQRLVRRKIPTPTMVPLKGVKERGGGFRKYSSDIFAKKANTHVQATKPNLKHLQCHSPRGAKGDSETCLSFEIKSKAFVGSELNFGSMNSQTSYSEFDDGECQAHLTESYKLVPKMMTNNFPSSRHSEFVLRKKESKNIT